MKKIVISHYLPDFIRTGDGERYDVILRYFLPEVVTAFLLYSALSLFDSYLIGHLRSTSTYAVLGMTNTLLHTIVKLAEAFAVGTTVLTGRFNGMHAYVDVGRTARDTFWLTIILGFLFSCSLYGGAYLLYLWYELPPSMVQLGIPFLRLRSLGLFFSFVYFGFVGFLRGIKNTMTPMCSFLVGAIVFILVDYALVLGNFGFPALGLQGSAIASIAQNIVMVAVLLVYIVFDRQNYKYLIRLFEPFRSPVYFKELIFLSLPVAVDKVVFAFSYVWLQLLICPMGKYWAATYCVTHSLEKVAILPAIALAQVVTLLVSNDFGKGDWDAVRSNVRKVLILAMCMVVPILVVFSLWTATFVSFFDQKAAFTDLAVKVFPLVSVFVVFDLLQLILSGALRGIGDVRVVMVVRVAICFLYFLPLSYLVSKMALDPLFKFILLYGLFYLGTAFMSLIYINRLRGNKWHRVPAGELQ